MVHWDIRRTPTSVILLTELGAEYGVAPQTALKGTRLSSERLLDPATEVTARQEQTVIRNLITALDGREDLGLEAGSRYHLTTFGIWGFALISSPTLRGAVDVGLRYLDLTFAFSRIQARHVDGETQLVLDTPDLPAWLTRFAVERDAATIFAIQRELFSARIPLRRVTLAFPAPQRPERYAEVFGLMPEFEAAENLVVIDPDYLDQPLPQANAHTQALAQAQCRDLLDRRHARTGVAGQVRDLLLLHPSRPPDAEQAARSLHISSRTWRQRLAAEKTSFRELLDEIRERLAEEMLAGGLTVGEIAERLGYVELSSFSQAFRRWKGMGPRAYRAAQTGRR